MQYYFSNDGTNQQGPVERDQLKSAGVTARTMVWREGMSAWTPAGQVPELADLFGNEPPPMQPPPPSPGLPPQHLPPHPPSQETNGMAIASLICGILGISGFCCCVPIILSVLAVIFGHQARGQIRAGKGTGDTIALVGLVLGYIGIVAALAGIGLNISGHGMQWQTFNRHFGVMK
ncbi:MAG: GYF domain-containing protein [Tepidisphaeraceae bacterium]